MYIDLTIIWVITICLLINKLVQQMGSKFAIKDLE